MALTTPTATGFNQSFKAALVDQDTYAVEILGTIRYERNAVYKYVKFSGTTAIAIGDVLCYVATDTANTTVDGANTAFGAGVAITAVGTGTVLYGWMLVEGLATLSTAFAGSPAVGDNMTTSGASPPAVTKNAASNTMVVGNVVNVANKIMACTFPH